MDKVGPAIITIVAGIIGLAIVAVIVSQKANTQNVISSSGTALSNIINAAVSPVSGNTFGSTGQTTGGTTS